MLDFFRKIFDTITQAEKHQPISKPFSIEEIELFHKLIKAISQADFNAINMLLPPEDAILFESVSNRFTAYLEVVTEDTVPKDVQDAIQHQDPNFYKKLFFK